MARKKQQPKLTQKELITIYMEYMSTNNEEEPSIQEFCEHNGITEEDFYSYFDSLQQLEQEIWRSLLQHSIGTATDDALFTSFAPEEKLLSLYYTLFENIGLNQEYLKKNLRQYASIPKRVTLFKSMKPVYQAFVRNVFTNAPEYQPLLNIGPLKNIQKKSRDEAFWGLYLFLIDFWNKDESAEFEKTDAAIEKSVRLAISLMDTSPINNAIDFGKFLWKERGNYSFKKFR